MVLESIFNQVFQPCFYYSAIFLVISFICVKLLSKLCFFMDSRAKSIAFLVPLIIPLIVMLIFVPSTVFHLTSAYSVGASVQPNSVGAPLGPTGLTVVPSYAFNRISYTSVTGIICLAGMAVGIFFAASMLLFNSRVAKKILHILEAEPDDYPWLQETVMKMAQNLNMITPKVGFIDDLKPNAFNVGYGHGAMIVFSVGLLDVLDKDEVSAVALHELAHVKNHDFLFKSFCCTLTAVSFFNLFAYFSSSAVQRERELLADAKAAENLKQPSVLGNAIAKIFAALQSFPKDGVLIIATSNLFVTSSIACKPQILAAHPSVTERLANISMPAKSARPSNRKIVSALLVSMLIVSFSVAACYVSVDVQRRVGYPQSIYPQSPQSIGCGIANATISIQDFSGFGKSSVVLNDSQLIMVK